MGLETTKDKALPTLVRSCTNTVDLNTVDTTTYCCAIIYGLLLLQVSPGTALEGLQVVQLSAAKSTSGAVTREGHVYTWGSGNGTNHLCIKEQLVGYQVNKGSSD